MAEIAWSDEKGSLMDRVADFTKILQNKDNEIANISKSITEKANKREESIKSEISALQQDLQRAQNTLEEQKELVSELRSRLFSTEDSLEFEQMRFKKEKEDLDKIITEEKSKYSQLEKKKDELEEKVKEDMDALSEVQAKLNDEVKQFSRERKSLEEKVDDVNRVRQLKAKQMGERYNKIRNEMTTLWVNAKSDARKQENKLKKKISKQNDEITELEKTLTQGQAIADEFDQFKKEMEIQQESFLKEKQEMEKDFDNTLSDRDAVLLGLEDKISTFKDGEIVFQDEVSNLKDNLVKEKSEQKELEDKIESEKVRYNKQKQKLEEEISEIDRKSKLEMNETWKKFNKSRADMTSMLVEARSDADANENKLKLSYEEKLSERERIILKVKSELENTRLKSIHLTRERDDTIKERDEARVMVRKADIRISEQMVKVASLSEVVVQRDQKIDEYESSYRQMLKLSARLTGKRIRKTTSRISNLVRRKKNETAEDQ